MRWLTAIPDGLRSRAGRLGVVHPDTPESDADREVDFSEDDRPVLPDQTRDDTDAGWGERSDSNDDRLVADRPPHWHGDPW
jgi:hypothetical protein